MKIEDIKLKITNIVNNSIYKELVLDDEENKDIESIISYFKDNKNILDDIKVIVKDRNNDNSLYFDNIIIRILTRLNKDIKLNILYNSDIYIELFKNKIVLLRIWQTLSKKDKLKYINDKKKCNEIDYYIFNEAIKEKSNFKENYILKEVIENKIVRDKIPSLSLEVKATSSMVNNIDLSDYELCSKFTKDSYTNLVIKSCNVLEDYKELINKNNKVLNLIERNRIIFKNTENKYIVSYLKDNLDMIGKFNNKYLSYFTNEEIENIYKEKNISNETFSSILERMYKIYPNRAKELITENNLSKCVKHSLDIYPFERLDNNINSIIFNNHMLFNRFLDTIMIEAISNYNSEEDITNMLRNPVFINDQSNYSIQLLLNRLSFRTVFNMLQIKDILDKIDCLNVRIDSNDKVFIKSFLDSPSLVDKLDHSMLYEMLINIDNEDVLYYLDTPYIINHLTNDEVIEVTLNKNINIYEIMDSIVINKKLNKNDIITYIDRIWKNNIDLAIFNNKNLVKLLFGLSDEQIDKIDFNEVNYLFETIKTKSYLSKQDDYYTVLTYKSVLAAYLTFGIEDTIKIVSDGNMKINLDKVKELKSNIINERISRFKEENATIIQNIHNKVDTNLKKLTNYNDINSFAKVIKKDTYLDNIIYLMLENNYCSYNMVIELFYDYVTRYNMDPYFYKKELYNFCNNFVDSFVTNEANKYNNEFYQKMFNNFKLKESIIYNRRKEFARNFIKKQKIKLLVEALSKDVLDYSYIFNDGYDIKNLKKDFIEAINIKDEEYDNVIKDILIPLSLDSFNIEVYLNKLGLEKPKEYDLYYNYMNNIKEFNKINKEITKLRNNYSDDEVINLMEGILYNNDTSIKIKAKDRRIISKINNSIDNIDGEIYIDKKNIKFTYGKKIDVYDTGVITDYNNCIKTINGIINGINSFINKNINSSNIEQKYSDEYLKRIALEKLVCPLTNKYYELKKRVLSLKDIEKIFNGYKINDYHKVDNDLKDFLIKTNNIVMVAEGYYDGIVDNLGLIINNFEAIKKEYKNIFPDEEMNLINAEKVLKIINFDLDVISKSIEYDIIKSITDDDYYIDANIKDRLDNLEYLYKESYKRVSSTVPYIKFKEDDYEVSIVDNYNHDIFRYAYNSNFRIGSRGNDFLHYVILNKNGIKVVIKKDNKIIATVLGLRNGNTVYLNKLEGIYDDRYEQLLNRLASEIISSSKKSKEPIEFVTILVNKLLDRSNGIKIDSTLCPIIDNPLSTSYKDYLDFKKTKYLNTTNEKGFYSNYREKVDTLLASSVVVDKNNFNYYDASSIYLRERNSVLKLSNNIEDYYIFKINTIINLCKEEKVLEFDGDIKLSTIDTIYLGDDFVIFITYSRQLIKYVLPYDYRAMNEVNLIISSLKN